MRVLHVYKDYYPPTVGGIETHIHALATGMSRNHDISVLICNTRGSTETHTIEGIHVTKVACFGRLLSNPLSPTFPLWLRRQKVDILHFHLPLPTAVVAYLLSRPRGRLVATYHSDIVRQSWAMGLYGPIQKLFLKKAARIIVTSPNYLESSIPLRPHQAKCVVVPLGIDLSIFQATDAVIQRAGEIREQYGPRIVLFVGKLRHYKGLTYLLTAMKNVQARLIVAGAGPFGSQLRAQTQRDGIADRVHFLGDIEREKLPPYYYACDVFCLPSILRSEAYGLVQLEAAACGKPVVSTALNSGVPFVNQHEKTGLVVPPRAPEALADGLNRLLRNRSMSEEMGQFAKQRAFDEFSLEKMIARVEEVYREL